MLWKKIKNDLKKVGSNKLSKYLKTCKEKTKNVSKNEVKLTKPISKKKNSVFSQRTGSVDLQKQLSSLSNFKQAFKKEMVVRNLSKDSRKKSKCTVNKSVERSQSHTK